MRYYPQHLTWWNKRGVDWFIKDRLINSPLQRSYHLRGKYIYGGQPLIIKLDNQGIWAELDGKNIIKTYKTHDHKFITHFIDKHKNEFDNLYNYCYEKFRNLGFNITLIGEWNGYGIGGFSNRNKEMFFIHAIKISSRNDFFVEPDKIREVFNSNLINTEIYIPKWESEIELNPYSISSLEKFELNNEIVLAEKENKKLTSIPKLLYFINVDYFTNEHKNLVFNTSPKLNRYHELDEFTINIAKRVLYNNSFSNLYGLNKSFLKSLIAKASFRNRIKPARPKRKRINLYQKYFELLNKKIDLEEFEFYCNSYLSLKTAKVFFEIFANFRYKNTEEENIGTNIVNILLRKIKRRPIIYNKLFKKYVNKKDLKVLQKDDFAINFRKSEIKFHKLGEFRSIDQHDGINDWFKKNDTFCS